MNMHTVNSGSSSGFAIEKSLLSRTGASKSTTFRSNSYIRALNRALQAETRALSIYQNIGHRFIETKLAEETRDFHESSAKILIRLIIFNRGIPERHAVINLGLMRTVVRLCRIIPGRLGKQTALSTLLQLEMRLVHRYSHLLEKAPARDRAILKNLKRRAVERAARIAQKRRKP